MIFFAVALLCVGGFVALISAIWTLALAFQRHLLWGLAVLLLPFSSIAFLFVNWREARTPFILGVGSLGMLMAAFSSLPRGTISQPWTFGMAALQSDRSTQKQIAEQDMANARRKAELQLRLIKLQAREAELLERKASLAPDDTVTAVALSEQIKRYNAELQPLLAQAQQLRVATE